LSDNDFEVCVLEGTKMTLRPDILKNGGNNRRVDRFVST
jgi:hypothetical protein